MKAPGRFNPPWVPQRTEAQRKAEVDRRRGSAASRGYNATWRRLRLVVLREEPLCRFHAERGETVAATEVDHIDGDARNNDRDNLRPLCKPCHSERTARDQGFNRNKRTRPAR